jgi:glycosyltransferase involved in cell wall biosynthesis
MATATPVVATPQAARAIHAQHNKEIMLAATPTTFAHAVLELLDSADRRRSIGLAGREYVENNHAWPRVIADLVTIYKRVASQGTRAVAS